MYQSQIDRYERIRTAAAAKLRARHAELTHIDREEVVQRLIGEALDEEFDDVITASYEWDNVERIVRRVVSTELNE